MYVPGHILHVGCGSVGLIFPCPISGAAKNKATATTNKKFFIRTSFFGLHIIALMGIFPKIRKDILLFARWSEPFLRRLHTRYMPYQLIYTLRCPEVSLHK